MKLLTRGQSSPKLTKQGAGIESVILHLSPGRTCPWASKGCLSACLNTAGRGAMTKTQEARQRRTDLFFGDRPRFMAQLSNELQNLENRAARKGFKAVARLNGTSDIPWESIQFGGDGPFAYWTVMERFPAIQFYDYSKSTERARKARYADDWPPNYSLTVSRTETWSGGDVRRQALHGINTAVVFDVPKGQPLPETFEGVEVIDGREHDWRFKDPRGVVVGLSALGKARRDATGFVVQA